VAGTERSEAGKPGKHEELGDFTATTRTVPLGILAIGVGVLAAYVATALLALISLATNLFYYQRWSLEAVSPAGHHLGVWAALVPVVGCLIIGFMARYGSERIRGHGIPEALEAILIRGSRIQPRVALLKPISSAISIGSGGPFGAEGPIIMTGGAFGSLIAQFLHLTAAERKTLLVAGAAAGMSATFAAPVAAVLLAVELLLFELKPRSLVPVALASAAAAGARRFLLGPGPLFPASDMVTAIGPVGLLACAAIGLAAGGLSALLTASVYAAEDSFLRLKRLHWMWWPALGGIVVGLGGLICPEALGVGYDQIERLLRGGQGIGPTLRLMAAKATIWAVSLGSGTSGGVLAPLLMMGCALGVIGSRFLPDYGASFWPLVAMAAILAGTMRAPLTALVFAIELTGRFSMSLPLLTACVVAHAFTVLLLKRSILTEKVARRGYHVSREYAIDPLEILFVREVTETAAEGTAGDVTAAIAATGGVVASPDEPLRVVVHRMAETGHTALPVIIGHAGNGTPPRLVGFVTLNDVLKARVRHLEEERRRERIIPLRSVLPFGRAGGTPAPVRRDNA
jgi:CIC family chloride channel protein